jgi:hypothetical protein
MGSGIHGLSSAELDNIASGNLGFSVVSSGVKVANEERSGSVYKYILVLQDAEVSVVSECGDSFDDITLLAPMMVAGRFTEVTESGGGMVLAYFGV